MKRADKAGGLSTGFIKKKWKARPPKPIPKISDQDTYRVNAILLNKNTFRITEVNNGNGKYKKRTKKRACIAGSNCSFDIDMFIPLSTSPIRCCFVYLLSI